MEINRMSLEEWRKELIQQYDIQKLYLPICDEIAEYLYKTKLSLSSSVLANEFDVTPQRMNRLLKALVMLKRVACNPSIKRQRQYWIDPEYAKIKNQQIKEENTAKESVLNLKPTTLSASDKKAVEEQIKRLKCYLKADTINKDHQNNLLVTLEDTHIMIQYTPQKEKFEKFELLLSYLNQFVTGEE